MLHRTRPALPLLAALGLAPSAAAQDAPRPNAQDLRPSQVWEVVVDGDAIGEALILAQDPPADAPPMFEVLLTHGSVAVYQRFYASALVASLRRHLRDVDRLAGAPRPDSIPAGVAVAEPAGVWFARECAEAARLGTDDAPDAPLAIAELEIDRQRAHPAFAGGQVWRWKSDPRRLLSVAGTGYSDALGWVVEIDLLPSPDSPTPLPRTAMLASALERAVGEQVERIDRPAPPAPPIAAVGYGTLAELEASLLPWKRSEPTPTDDDASATNIIRIHHPPGSFAFVHWNGRDYSIGNLAEALAAAKIRTVEIHARRGDPYSLLHSVVEAVEAGGVPNMGLRTDNE